MAKRLIYPSQSTVKSLLDYDPATGIFVWKNRPSVSRGNRIINSRNAGKIAGSPDAKGYIRICINNVTYAAHCIAWLYVHAEWPWCEIDHRDGVTSDNRIQNLRKATFSQNKTNQKRRSDNRSGLKGVKWHIQAKKWWARIQSNGERMSLGMFDCPAAAHLAYVVAADKYHGEFARVA